jgi:sulfate transport system ATP-binding protein
LEVADRVVVMNQARIEQTGTPEEVFHHPASEFVMDFMGSVNLFNGRIESGKAVFGPLVMDHAASGAVEGQTARMFVRPYDPDIATAAAASRACTRRADFLPVSGSSRIGNDHHFQAHHAFGQFPELRFCLEAADNRTFIP